MLPRLFGADAQTEFFVRNLHWTGPPAATRTVEVDNPYGDIRLRPSEVVDIVVSATVQELAANQPPVDLSVTEIDGRSVIAVRLPAGVEKFSGRVDLTVLLPGDVAVSARSTGGNIHVKSIAGPLIVRTQSGSVFASFRRLTKRADDDVLVLESATGDIEVVFLQDADLRIHASSGGRITTDFPNALSETLRHEPGLVEGRLGSGKTGLTIRSASGNIKLKIAEPILTN